MDKRYNENDTNNNVDMTNTPLENEYNDNEFDIDLELEALKVDDDELNDVDNTVETTQENQNDDDTNNQISDNDDKGLHQDATSLKGKNKILNLSKGKGIIIGGVVILLLGILFSLIGGSVIDSFRGAKNKEINSTETKTTGFTQLENTEALNKLEEEQNGNGILVKLDTEPVVNINDEKELPPQNDVEQGDIDNQSEVNNLDDNSLPPTNDREITEFDTSAIDSETNSNTPLEKQNGEELVKPYMNDPIGKFKGDLTSRLNYEAQVRQKEQVALSNGFKNPYGNKGATQFLGYNGNGSYGNIKNNIGGSGISGSLVEQQNLALANANKERTEQSILSEGDNNSFWRRNPDASKDGEKENGKSSVRQGQSPQYNPNFNKQQDVNVIGETHRVLGKGYGRINQGDVIPSILSNEINSDFPSSVIAYVRTDVYDSIEGYKLLIPKGSKIIGDVVPLKANSGIDGVERVITIWNRIILPNGHSITLPEFRGSDLVGIDGLEGSINRRLFAKISTAILSGIFESGTSLVKTLPEILANYYLSDKGTKQDGEQRAKNEAIQKSIDNTKSGLDGASSNVLNTIGTLSSGVINRANTIRLPKGTRFNIVINTDIELKQYKQ